MKLENLVQPPFNTTLMGVVKAVLDYYGIKMSPAMAFGGSGHAFLINIHDQLCPSGPYCWKYDGFSRLVRNLGLEMTDLGFFHKGSSPAERKAIEQTVKGHLDRGLPCSLVNMENQVIYGYDETKLSTAQPWPKCTEFPPATLTYETWSELGDEVHINFFVFKKLAKQDDAVIIRDSLHYAVELFKTPEKYSLDRYAIGLKAYDNWAKAAPEFGSKHGNWWNAQVWSECRAMAAGYFAEIAEQHARVAEPARKLSQDYKEIAAGLERISSKEMAAEEKVKLAQELKDRERVAGQKVEDLAEFFA